MCFVTQDIPDVFVDKCQNEFKDICLFNIVDNNSVIPADADIIIAKHNNLKNYTSKSNQIKVNICLEEGTRIVENYFSRAYYKSKANLSIEVEIFIKYLWTIIRQYRLPIKVKNTSLGLC